MEETIITVAEISEFTFAGSKKGYNLVTDDGTKYACFSTTEMAKITPMVPVRIKYQTVERNGYENRNIKQVANDQDKFDEKPAATGGGRPGKADPDKLKQDRELEIARNQSIQRQVAIKAVVELTVAGKIELSTAANSDFDFWYNRVMDKLTTQWVKK